MRRRRWALAPWSLLLLSPWLPRASAAPPSAPSAAPSASAAPATSASARRPSMAPDPAPLVTRRKWHYELFFHEGAIFAPTPRPHDAEKPTETPRRMGRFAIELYNGPDLVERVRFDVPMLNGDPFTGKTRPRDAPPDMARRVRVKVKVEVPATDRANRAVLLDRATEQRIRLPWPAQPAEP